MRLEKWAGIPISQRAFHVIRLEDFLFLIIKVIRCSL